MLRPRYWLASAARLERQEFLLVPPDLRGGETNIASPTTCEVVGATKFGSGPSFRDPDNIALELFARPPEDGLHREDCHWRRRLRLAPARAASTTLPFRA